MWFWSYLHARSQCVYVDGKVSGFEVVDVGVPQGSVLGALLYILFVNDLPEVVHGLATLDLVMVILTRHKSSLTSNAGSVGLCVDLLMIVLTCTPVMIQISYQPS